jgi:hypothetical protein
MPILGRIARNVSRETDGRHDSLREPSLSVTAGKSVARAKGKEVGDTKKK